MPNVFNLFNKPSTPSYKIVDVRGDAVPAQLVPISESVLGLPGRNSSASSELVFLAQLPQQGGTTFFVSQTPNRRVLAAQASSVRRPRMGVEDIEVSVGAESLSIVLDKDTGLLKFLGVVRPDGVQMVPVNQTFMYYVGMNGQTSDEDDRPSGAYIFRPNGTAENIADKAQVRPRELCTFH